MKSVEERKNRILLSEQTLPDQQLSNKFAGLKVLGLVADTSACGYYRVINPLHMLKLHGATVEYGSHHSLNTFLDYDIILAPRQHSPEVYEILRFIAWEGKNIIFEIDDDLDAVEPSSPAYIAYHQGSPELKMIPKMMNLAHGMTLTTPELARWYYQHNQNIAIIGNYIDLSFRDWCADVQWFNGEPLITPKPIPRPPEWEGKIVIGWSGGTTHWDDIHHLFPQIKSLLERNDNVIFAMYSAYHMYEEVIQKYNFSKDKVQYIEARHFMDHPTGLRGIDIALAPITCCQFNLAKSNLKCLEAMAMGSVVIASNVGPYARFERNHPGCILTVGQGKHSQPTWAEAINLLIKNPEMLRKMKDEGRQLVYDQYTLEKNFHKWPEAWASIIEQKRKGIVGPPSEKNPKEFYKSYKRLGRNSICECGSGLKKKNCCVEAWG